MEGSLEMCLEPLRWPEFAPPKRRHREPGTRESATPHAHASDLLGDTFEHGGMGLPVDRVRRRAALARAPRHEVHQPGARLLDGVPEHSRLPGREPGPERGQRGRRRARVPAGRAPAPAVRLIPHQSPQGRGVPSARQQRLPAQTVHDDDDRSPRRRERKPGARQLRKLGAEAPRDVGQDSPQRRSLRQRKVAGWVEVNDHARCARWLRTAPVRSPAPRPTPSRPQPRR